jgi:energy-coupling factor transporter ATP-binding protein EcfA2
MYRILSLTLVGYRRMLLNEIRKITITPTSAIQLILGTNGCGKSSLLDQLTPLPADKDDFIKGGSKSIIIESHGHHFVCESHIDKSIEHSFVMDGVELNPGGTAQVQKDLCKKFFNVTPDSHELAKGEIRFTKLKPAERREWIMSLCEGDNEFALDAYDKLRKHANHLTGAVTLNKKNLGVETAKIMSDAEEAKLEKEVNDLRAELNILQAERIPVERSSSYHLDQRGRALQALNDVSVRLLRLKVVAPYEYECWWADYDENNRPKRAYFRSLNEVDMEIDRLKHIVTGKEAILVTVNEQFTKLQRQHDILIKTGAEGVESIDRQINQLREHRSGKVSRLRLGLLFQDARGAHQALQPIAMPLIDVLRELPENADRRYGRAQYDSLQQQMMLSVDNMNKHVEYLHRLKAQKDHADLHRGENKHTCPSCHHSWVVGVDEKQYALIVAGINEGEAKLSAMKTLQTALQKDLVTLEAYFAQYREIMGYTKSITILQPFWEYLIESKLILESPAEAINAIQYLQRDLLVSIEIQEIEEKLEELSKLRVQAAEVGDANLNEVRVQMEVVADKLGQLTVELSHVQRSVSEYSEYRRQLNTGLQLGEELQRLYALAEQEQYDHIEAFRRESIQHCLREVENVMSLKEESLRAVKRQKELVNMLREQVKRFELQETAAKGMVKALSPTHGLIAAGILGFIRAFVGSMNTFISRIWRYPLQIIPTGYDTERGEQTIELDYKFKMIVGREDNIKKDVSLGSEGIKEVIDLAFERVAAKYLNLTDAPRFLDERGKAFDDEHRNAFTEAIKWDMDNTNCSQLFMISHYALSYGAFSNAHVCVIDDANVVLPSGRTYNEHVKIVH